MADPLKVVIGIRKKDGVNQAELFDIWEHRHAPALKAAAKPQHYTITFFEERPGRTPPAFDGVEELTFPDRDSYERAMGKDAPPLAGDEGFAAMADPERSFRLLASEIVPVDDAPVTRESEKVMLFVKRLDDVAPEKFFGDWRSYHSENVAAGFRGGDGAQRYAVILADQGERGAFDGFPIFWWRDTAARTAPRDPNRPPGPASNDGFDELCAPGTLRLIGHEFAVV